jgi:flagellar FliL protein
MLQKLFGKKKAETPDAGTSEAGAGGEGDANANAEENANALPVWKRFGKKSLMLMGGGALALLIGLGGGGYYLLSSGGGATQGAGDNGKPIVPPQVGYYDVPDVIVNIQTADGSPAYLKLGVALELDNAAEKAGIQPLMPRIVDQFQGYLRELRVEDLRGSAGVMRLKEELLRRVNVAAAPYQVRDVLLKEMIVQ